MLALLLLTGCAATPSRDTAASIEQPPETRWRTSGEALGISAPAQGPAELSGAGPAFVTYSDDPAELRAQVAVRCGEARLANEQDSLPGLVTDLYLSSVDPAQATEALVKGSCGSLADIVREMVAQGGDDAVAPVINRALFLTGPGAEGIIESAASSGLERNVAGLGQHSGPTRAGNPLSYSMAYFPSRGEPGQVQSSAAASNLYTNATPGYGVYTFVLLGSGFGGPSELDKARYAELLRVIETYVLAADEGRQGPSADAHAFLIAVHPDRQGAALLDQTGADLSEPMRREYAQLLRRQGESALAQRIDGGAGPFLVSSPEPRLLPTRADSPRLVTDLSEIGPEYMYAVIDAYDRRVPEDARGGVEGLAQIQGRLLGLFTSRLADRDLDPAIKDAWVFLLGPAATPAEGVAESPTERPAPSAARPGA